jgi:hypothetical protein
MTSPFIDKFNRLIAKKDNLSKEEYYQMVQSLVYDEIYRGINDNEIFFEGEQFDADTWKNLSEEQKEQHPFKWKNNNNFMIEALMKTLTEKDMLFTDIRSNPDGVLDFNLTDAGQQLWAVGMALKIDMNAFLWNRVKQGLGKEFAQYHLFKKGEIVEGYKRYRVGQ